MMNYVFTDRTNICKDSNINSVAAYNKTMGITGIMKFRKSRDTHATHRDRLKRSEMTQVNVFDFKSAVFERSLCDKNRHLKFFNKRSQTLDMIAVLVSNEDCFQLV